ncbi:hypothetical protein IQ273_08380 [Nodosilinea sp. LEGE 07298]|jgi:hypothetical protein|uniref:hypothetical protein n=1 Tax=Nodosilinea sp. LEGE 07298 TaxID=2777970 RepID=UPI0018813B19|nr:hypothetical protein [Nodosilinea sp. LEGE 07298]MBE9109431.1 hypothetical protein [Nodosilinea sp. LEGE 07298]
MTHLKRRFTSWFTRRFTRYGVVGGSVGLALVAMTSCGASLDEAVGYGLRDRLSTWPGLASLDPVTPIAEASQSQGSTVYLAGTVERQLPLVSQGLYELVDESGAIWVLSSAAPPAVGTSLTIRATLQYEQILLQGQDIGQYYAAELERLPQE